MKRTALYTLARREPLTATYVMVGFQSFRSVEAKRLARADADKRRGQAGCATGPSSLTQPLKRTTGSPASERPHPERGQLATVGRRLSLSDSCSLGQILKAHPLLVRAVGPICITSSAQKSHSLRGWVSRGAILS